MKNLTLLAAMAVCGVGIANAQYVGDPALSKTTSTGNLYDVVLLDNASIESLKTSGKTVQDLRADDVNRFLYVWDNTFVAGDGSYPGVDMQMDGYVSFDVSTMQTLLPISSTSLTTLTSTAVFVQQTASKM